MVLDKKVFDQFTASYTHKISPRRLCILAIVYSNPSATCNDIHRTGMLHSRITLQSLYSELTKMVNIGLLDIGSSGKNFAFTVSEYGLERLNLTGMITNEEVHK